MKRDVIVVGAGPVGSYLSLRIVERGYRVLLLEKKGETGRHICAGVIGAEAFRRFPLPKESIFKEVKSVALISPSGNRLRHTTEEPMAYVVDRVAFDQALLERSLEAGVEFNNFCQVMGIRREPGGMKVTCRYVNDEKGGLETFRASLVVLATGYNPGLLASSGLSEYPGAVAGIQTVNVMREVEEIEVCFGKEIAPGGFAWLVPMGEGQVRVGLVVDNEAKGWLDRFLSSSPVLSRTVENHSPVRHTLIPRGPIPKTYKDGLLVVGEAAGQVKSTTYGGVYYGLICAAHAVETIEDAFRQGEFGEDVFSRYEEGWQGEIGKEIDLGARLRERVKWMEDGEMDNLFMLLGSNGMLSRLRSAVRFDWHRDLIGLTLRHGLLSFSPFKTEISIDKGTVG
jgi:digeranylgeranylglycerophospholipid reductase